MYISEAQNCQSNHYLSCCGLFEDTLQQKPALAKRTGKAGKGGGRTENICIRFSMVEKG